MDSIQEYCKAQFALKEARGNCLDNLGLTENELKELEQQAIIQMGDSDVIHTDYGILQKIFDKPVQYVFHRMKEGEITPAKIFKSKLKLITKEKDRKSTRLNSSHIQKSRMPSSA